MNTLLKILCWTLIAALPLLLLVGLQHFGARQLAAGFILIAALRLVLIHKQAGLLLSRTLPAGLLVIAMTVAWSGESHWFRYYPLLVNAALLLLFAGSLWRGMPVVERLARLQDPTLPAEGVRYTRRVTQVWCVFFIINGSIAAYTALFSSFSHWAWYNGGVAYLLMGLLFAGEWLVRRRVMESHHA